MSATAFAAKINSYDLSGLNEDSARGTILELLEYLSRWLIGHILGSDILIGQFPAASNKPAVPVFTDEYKTGIEQLDEEHKVLFDIIAKIHFSDEEAYMESIGYDGLEKQNLLHQNFIDKMTELDYDHIDDNQDAYLYDFLGFLQNWLVNHILKVDKLIPLK